MTSSARHFHAEGSIGLLWNGHQTVVFVLSVTGSNLEKMCARCKVLLKISAPTSQETQCVSVIKTAWLIKIWGSHGGAYGG
jgi:hypothetical protein